LKKSIKALLLIILIIAGFLTKACTAHWCGFINNYLGGIIYVLFLIILVSLIFPYAHPLRITLIIFGFTCFIELSQLIHNDFLNNLRKSFFVRALIGNVFNLLDFVFYLIGSLIGYCVLNVSGREILKKIKK